MVVELSRPASESLERRAQRHAALADPHRLQIVDELALSDRSPTRLAELLGIGSNLLAHHLGILEAAGLLERLSSAGDGRRRYLRLTSAALVMASGPAVVTADGVLFVCTHNSARSQLAAALWNARSEVAATSAGTHPAAVVHPLAVAAAARGGLDLSAARPKALEELERIPSLVITVCDRAYEELGPIAPVGDVSPLHWSTPDPAEAGAPAAFDGALASLASRIDTFHPHVARPAPRRTRPIRRNPTNRRHRP